MDAQLRLPPITLIPTVSSVQYDEAGNEVRSGLSVSIPGPPHASLPTHLQPPTTHAKVPPLAYYCIQALVKRLGNSSRRSDIIQSLGTPRPYLPSSSGQSDPFSLLIPHMHPTTQAVRWKYVDPRLWITVIRLHWPDTLPTTFLEYPMALSDPYLPYIQYLEPSDHFTLIVVLDLVKQQVLTDETIVSLKGLHQLTILDTSWTKVTNLGVKKLVGTRSWDDEFSIGRGPWKLRSWALRGCKVDDSVSIALCSLPLLCIIDLRNTKCTRCPHLNGWTSTLPSEDYTELFHPSPLLHHLDALKDLASSHNVQLFRTSQPPFSIYIDTLFYPPKPVVKLEYNENSMSTTAKREFPAADGYFMLGPDNKSVQGSVLVREKQIEAREEFKRKMMRMGAKDMSAEMASYAREVMPGTGGKHQVYGFSPRLPASKGVEVGESDEERSARLAEERLEALQNAQIAADKDRRERIQSRERELRRHAERRAIEESRQYLKMSASDILNRSLMLVRVPPPYSELLKALNQHVEVQAALAQKREENKRAEMLSRGGATALIDKKRKASDGDIWRDVCTNSSAPKIKAQRNPSLSNMRKSRNPFASQR